MCLAFYNKFVFQRRGSRGKQYIFILFTGNFLKILFLSGIISQASIINTVKQLQNVVHFVDQRLTII